jgi:hypothetical protein
MINLSQTIVAAAIVALCMNVWINGCMQICRHASMDEMYRWLEGCMNACLDLWMHGRMDAGVDVCLRGCTYICVNGCVYEWMDEFRLKIHISPWGRLTSPPASRHSTSPLQTSEMQTGGYQTPNFPQQIFKTIRNGLSTSRTSILPAVTIENAPNTVLATYKIVTERAFLDSFRYQECGMQIIIMRSDFHQIRQSQNRSYITFVLRHTNIPLQ